MIILNQVQVNLIYNMNRNLDTFCYLTVQTAPCYVPSFWHNTGVWQTDRHNLC